jgi:hypothetical protein
MLEGGLDTALLELNLSPNHRITPESWLSRWRRRDFYKGSVYASILFFIDQFVTT